MNNSKRDFLEGLLGVVMCVGGLLLLAYFLFIFKPSLQSAAANSTTPAPPTPTPKPIEIWDAHRQARELVSPKDAMLVSASTQWQASNEETLLNGASNWSFVFYSATAGTVLNVVVGADKAQVVNQTRVWVAPQALADGAWQSGPQDALLAFLAYGGREFLENHPQAVVDLHLAQNDFGVPVWAVVALDTGDRSLLALSIDANTMEVLSKRS